MEAWSTHAEPRPSGGGSPAVPDGNITPRPGEILTLIGPSGAGKSALLKSAARQWDGVVFADAPSAAGEGEWARVRSAISAAGAGQTLVMEHPEAFLDLRRRVELASLLRELAARKTAAVVLTLHDLPLARRVSDTIMCVRGGRIDRAGPPEEILNETYLEELYGLPNGSFRAYFDGFPAEPPAPGPHYAFFQNRRCESFPCHEGVAEEDFNCLFCYCPLYALGERCGGGFTYTAKGRKDCTRCAFPHIRENYRAVLARYPEIAALAEKK